MSPPGNNLRFIEAEALSDAASGCSIDFILSFRVARCRDQPYQIIQLVVAGDQLRPFRLHDRQDRRSAPPPPE
jgi:hypothetical protein